MADYHYNAADSEGKVVRGILAAADKHDLVAQLQQQGLLLVSCQVLNESVPAGTPVLTPPSATRDIRPSRSDDSLSGSVLPPVTKKHRAIMIALLMWGILIGFWRAYDRRHSMSSTNLLNKKIALVRCDMRRAEIERIFDAPYPDGPDPAKTWYAVPPDFIVGIAYDQAGRVPSGNDRLIEHSPIAIRHISRR